MRGAFTDKTKRLVAIRQDCACAICGVLLLNPIDYSPLRAHQWHHRLPRRSGGRRGHMAKVAASPANCLLLCERDHSDVESRRSLALGLGWLVREGDLPALVRVLHLDRWVLLKDDGSVVPSFAPQPDGERAA